MPPASIAVLRDRHHAIQLRWRRRPIRHAEHIASDRTVRHIQGDVDADSARLETRTLGAQVGRAAAVRVQCDRGDALCNQLSSFLERALEPLRRMRVDVDESWGDRQAARVDHPRRGRVPSRPMSTIRPPRMPMSVALQGLPLPSRTRPLRISKS